MSKKLDAMVRALMAPGRSAPEKPVRRQKVAAPKANLPAVIYSRPDARPSDPYEGARQVMVRKIGEGSPGQRLARVIWLVEYQVPEQFRHLYLDEMDKIMADMSSREWDVANRLLDAQKSKDPNERPW